MLLKCYKCGHSWNYKGRMDYLTCPGCYYKIRKDEALVKEDIGMQKLLTTIPQKVMLPTKKLRELPTTTKKIRPPLQIERPKILYPGFKIYTDQFGEKVGMREIKQDQVIRIIPRDPIKFLEHQRSFL